jgi:hypothetical protein
MGKNWRYLAAFASVWADGAVPGLAMAAAAPAEMVVPAATVRYTIWLGKNG